MPCFKTLTLSDCVLTFRIYRSQSDKATVKISATSVGNWWSFNKYVLMKIWSSNCYIGIFQWESSIYLIIYNFGWISIRLWKLSLSFCFQDFMSPYRVSRCIQFHNIGKVLYFVIYFWESFFLELPWSGITLNSGYPEFSQVLNNYPEFGLSENNSKSWG